MSIDEHSSKRKVKIGTSLGPDLRSSIINCLKRNRDVFTWSHSDMKGIDPNLACHRLNIDPKFPPRR